MQSTNSMVIEHGNGCQKCLLISKMVSTWQSLALINQEKAASSATGEMDGHCSQNVSGYSVELVNALTCTNRDDSYSHLLH